jgi:hypothetical protein
MSAEPVPPEGTTILREARPAPVYAVGPSPDAAQPRLVIVGCGALARELLALTAGIPGVRVEAVDAKLHMRPQKIAEAVAAKVEVVRERFGRDVRIFVGYADCGTGGALDAYLEREGIERIEGAHCFEFYAGATTYEALQEEEVGTFYLTDFLARQFDSIIVAGLGLDRHPELRDAYFGNYRRLIYLAQTDDDELTSRARAAADRLGLAFERRSTGYGDLAAPIALAIQGAA